MKRTGNTRILKGTIYPFGDSRNVAEGVQVLDGVRKGIGYRIVKFSWMNTNIVNDGSGGQADGVAWCALTKCTDPLQQGQPSFVQTVANPGFQVSHQIAWTFLHAPSYMIYEAPFEVIDSDHIIYDELYVQARTVSSNGLITYIIEMEEYEITSNEQILYQIQTENQNVNND